MSQEFVTYLENLRTKLPWIARGNSRSRYEVIEPKLFDFFWLKRGGLYWKTLCLIHQGLQEERWLYI